MNMYSSMHRIYVKPQPPHAFNPDINLRLRRYLMVAYNDWPGTRTTADQTG